MKDEGNVHTVGREQGGHDSPATNRKRMPSDASDLEFSLTKSYQGGRPSSMTIHERQESVEENPNQGNQYTYIVYHSIVILSTKSSKCSRRNNAAYI
jgi:hypothetical protein